VLPYGGEDGAGPLKVLAAFAKTDTVGMQGSWMPEANGAARAAGIGRLGTAAAWISAVCCLPYLVSRVV
jgi:hypothetical protein